MSSKSVTFNGEEVPPGTRITIDLPLPQLFTHTPLTMPIHVVRGRRDGPRLFVSAAIHGDELNGIEIIRRLLRRRVLENLRGTLVAIPIVNVYGVIHYSRYLPDRRDLNRSFPGSERGSLAARLADVFMTEIVAKCTHGIDLHTASNHRGNLPQIRADLGDEETARLAREFDVPVLINAGIRDGSLRGAAAACGVPMLLYEAGEALRFDEVSIRAGVHGIVNVMRALGMLTKVKRKLRVAAPYIAQSSAWVRAVESGVFRSSVPLGAHVHSGDLLGVIADPFGDTETRVKSSYDGIVVGRTNLPLVHQGEALYHIACFDRLAQVAEEVEAFRSSHAEAIEADERPTIV